jgi:hypothetical protein
MGLQCGGLAPDGGRCPRNAAETIADIPLCATHLTGLNAALIPAGPAPQVDAEAVVYYIGDPSSGLVKIGTSTKLRSRVDAIRVRRPGRSCWPQSRGRTQWKPGGIGSSPRWPSRCQRGSASGSARPPC